jgi:hypothetical protein
MRLLTGFALVAVLLVAVGCATEQELLAAKNEGFAVNYPVKQQEAWRAALVVFAGAQKLEVHRPDGS